ncbi:MAG TPA: tyrosine--tRNA ligase [Chloroflexota bacterium]|nr:tyrosine--tRNA ligase [Chloroflexota bacterium]
MRFRVLDQVFEQFPTVCIGLVVVRGVDNTRKVPAIETALRTAEEEVAAGFESDGVRMERAFGPWRSAFSALGMNPGRFKSSVEALASRARKGSPLPDLGPIVNLVNATSLRYLLPIGSHDLDTVRGDIVVGPAAPGLRFTPLGQKEAEDVDVGEFVYMDDREVRTRRWVWRQSEHSKVTSASTNIVFPIDGWVGTNDAEVRDAQAALARFLGEELGAQTECFFVDSGHRAVEIWPESVVADQVTASADGFRMGGLAYREHATIVPPEPDAPDTGEKAIITAGARWLRLADLDPIGTLLERGTEDVVVRADLEARLRRGDRLRVKFGVDPTSPHLHLGHAVVLRKLRAFQRQGHTICLLIGDFTAQIGDASDRTAMRQMLSEDTVYQNLATYRKQIARILDEDLVEWSYNADWLGPLRFKDVVGMAANFTVAQMLERENFTNRYAAKQPIGLQELLYPLMQGYDSVALKSDIELGGTEQLFNLLAGRTLQRAFNQPPQAAMTLTLLLGLDGKKMSKSQGNAISLEDPAVDMYGKLMSISDAQILPYLELCTDLPLAEISAIAAALDEGANPMGFKKQLALEVTNLYHSAAQARKAQETFERVVQGRAKPEEMREETLNRGSEWRLLELLVALGFTDSNSEARRKTVEGAVWIDDKQQTDPNAVITVRDGMEVRLGKRNYRRVRLPS